MFLTKIRASEDRSPWGDFWFQPVSSRAMSGARLSADTAVQLSAVFRAVFLLSGHFAMLPLCMRKEGSLKPIKGHWLQKLFKKPNRWQSGFEWRMMLQGHLLLRGNAYNEIIEDRRGTVLELVPIHPDRVKIEMLADGDYRYRITDTNGTERVLVRGQVWHLRGLMNNGIVGLSVIECARESLGLGLAAQSYGSRFFANDARPAGGWIEYPGKFADREARKLFRESVQEAQSAANRGKMMVLDQGMKYHDIGLSNADAQFLESRKFQISEVARWFGVPPHKLGDLERATFSNIEQQSLEYISDSLLIWAEIWEAGVEDILLFDSEETECEFDFKKLLRGDSGARATKNQKLVMAGIVTRNEARAEEGLEPLDGLDEPLRPLNMVEESDAEEEEIEEESGEPKDKTLPPDENDQTDKTKDARLQAMVAVNASRLARRFAKAGNIEPELIAENFAIDTAQARTWAETFIFESEAQLANALTELGLKQC